MLGAEFEISGRQSPANIRYPLIRFLKFGEARYLTDLLAVLADRRLSDNEQGKEEGQFEMMGHEKGRFRRLRFRPERSRQASLVRLLNERKQVSQRSVMVAIDEIAVG